MKIFVLTAALLSCGLCNAQSSGIDFMAIQRGRAQAAEENYRDMQRQQELERMRHAQFSQQPQYQPYVDTQWESAYNVGQVDSGDPSILRCLYQTNGGLRFSINSRSIYCPSSVEVDPVSSRVKVQ